MTFNRGETYPPSDPQSCTLLILSFSDFGTLVRITTDFTCTPAEQLKRNLYVIQRPRSEIKTPTTVDKYIALAKLSLTDHRLKFTLFEWAELDPLLLATLDDETVVIERLGQRIYALTLLHVRLMKTVAGWRWKIRRKVVYLTLENVMKG